MGYGGQMQLFAGVNTVLRMPTNGGEMKRTATRRAEYEIRESPVIIRGLPTSSIT